MQIEYYSEFSKVLNRNMEFKVYGRKGIPFMIFPSSKGRFFDYENFGMVQNLSSFIENDAIQLVAVDGIDEETWYNFSISPEQRNLRHELYDGYVVRELIPFLHKNKITSNSKFITNGCSMGAFHALNFFFKHPEFFNGVIALSGLYRLDRGEFGLTGEDMPLVYFNSPVHYLAGLSDQKFIEAYRDSHIILCAGQGAYEAESIEDTRSIEQILSEKNIPAWIDYWGHDVNHDWPWWNKQMHYFTTILCSIR